MPDVEAAEAAAPAIEAVTCALPQKRRQLFLLFGLVSFSWLSFLLFMLSDLKLSEHQSLQENLDFKGADLDSRYGIESAAACYAACVEHPSCLAFTYVKSESVCWLKGEGYISKSNPNTISGMINATMAAERRSSNDYNASSSLYQDEVGGDDESWARDDFDDDEHNAVYDDDGYARRRYGGGDEGEEGDDERWGAVRVSAADVERYDDSTTLLGDVSVTTDVHSVRQCHELCVSEPACAAWTLDKYRYVCLLRLLNVSTVRYSADYIGGRLDASELATRAADWGDADADVEAAAAAREAEGEEAGDGRLKFVAQPAARYAGAPWALPSELRDGSGVLADVDLRGGDFKSVSGVDSVAACGAACAAEPACAAWTLSKTRQLCWLKSTNYTRIAQNRSKGLVSALRAAAAA